jgi:hypothetical protein
MPIQASAHKLAAEIKQYGNPPKFPEEKVAEKDKQVRFFAPSFFSSFGCFNLAC